MRRFIADQRCDEAGECANLNYWAFWVGDYAEQQTGDAFIGTTPLSAWHGNRLIRHLLDRLHGNIGFLELNIHTLWSLIRVRPEMISDSPTAQEMAAKVERLLDENLVSAARTTDLPHLTEDYVSAAANQQVTRDQVAALPPSVAGMISTAVAECEAAETRDLVRSGSGCG